MRSESLAGQRNVRLLLTIDCERSARRYPAICLLRGSGDDNTSCSPMANLCRYAGKHEMVVAIPDGSRSWYVSSPVDLEPKFGDFVVRDLAADVRGYYRSGDGAAFIPGSRKSRSGNSR